jgi:hypothetical protein
MKSLYIKIDDAEVAAIDCVWPSKDNALGVLDPTCNN